MIYFIFILYNYNSTSKNLKSISWAIKFAVQVLTPTLNIFNKLITTIEGTEDIVTIETMATTRTETEELAKVKFRIQLEETEDEQEHLQIIQGVCRPMFHLNRIRNIKQCSSQFKNRKWSSFWLISILWSLVSLSIHQIRVLWLWQRCKIEMGAGLVPSSLLPFNQGFRNLIFRCHKFLRQIWTMSRLPINLKENSVSISSFWISARDVKLDFEGPLSSILNGLWSQMRVKLKSWHTFRIWMEARSWRMLKLNSENAEARVQTRRQRYPGKDNRT